MDHNVFGTFFSTQHLAHPFACSCEEVDLRENHSLSISQRVFTVALAILVGIPTFGVGGVLAFYLLSAALKSRNAVWIRYCDEFPEYRTRALWYRPIYWGIPIYSRRTYSHFHHNTGGLHVPVGTGRRDRRHNVRVGVDPDFNSYTRVRVGERRSGLEGSSAAFTHSQRREDRGESARSSSFNRNGNFGGGGGGFNARSSSSSGFGGRPGGGNVGVGSSRGRR